MEKVPGRKNRIRAGEIVYLAVFAVLLFYTFLTTTMFQYQGYWPENLDRKLGMIGAIAVGIQMLETYLRADTQEFSEKSRKKRTAGTFICLFFISWTMVYSWLTYPQGMLFPIAMLIAGSAFVNFRNVLKVYLCVEVPMTVITIAASLSGVIENLTYHQKSHGYTTRMAFGFIYPTDFCAHLLFIALALVWLRGRKITILEIGLIVVEAVISYVFCYARTTTALLGLLLIGIVIQKLRRKKAEKKSGNGIWRGLSWVYCFWITPLVAVFSLAGSYFFSTDFGLLNKINAVMTGRLRYGQIGIQRYGIRPWGTYVEMHGAGMSSEKPANYFFLDNSYVAILVELGFMVLLGIVLLMILSFLSEWKKRSAMHILILTIIILTCIMEQHLTELWYNPFLLFAGEACRSVFEQDDLRQSNH